jgi:hypothetical protein
VRCSVDGLAGHERRLAVNVCESPEGPEYLTLSDASLLDSILSLLYYSTKRRNFTAVTLCSGRNAVTMVDNPDLSNLLPRFRRPQPNMATSVWLENPYFLSVSPTSKFEIRNALKQNRLLM